MTGPGRNPDRLDPQQEHAIALLLEAAPTLEAVAARLRISPRTLRRWRTEPAFAAKLREAQAEGFRDALATLKQAVGTATASLLAILADRKTGAAIKVAAARTLLDAGLRAVEVLDHEQRLSALEAAAGPRAA